MRELLAHLSTAPANQRQSKRGQSLNEHREWCKLNLECPKKNFNIFPQKITSNRVYSENKFNIWSSDAGALRFESDQPRHDSVKFFGPPTHTFLHFLGGFVFVYTMIVKISHRSSRVQRVAPSPKIELLVRLFRSSVKHEENSSKLIIYWPMNQQKPFSNEHKILKHGKSTCNENS